MIGIFHTIPTIQQLKSNYLFFDELQTSEQFIHANLDIAAKNSPKTETLEQVTAFRREFDYLLEEGVVKGKEDIEEKLLPEIGPFNYDIIHTFLTKSKEESNKHKHESIYEFFSHLAFIRQKFGIQIVGENAVFADHMAFVLTPVEWGLQEKFIHASHEPERTISWVNEFSSTYSRCAAVVLNTYFDDSNYFPLVQAPQVKRSDYYDDFENKNFAKAKAQAINLVINNFPIPDDTASWEKLIDFKKDPDSRSKLLLLRNWIVDISRKNYTQSELSGHLEYLLNEYSICMKKHKLEYRGGQLETVIVPLSEIAQNLLNFKFGDAVKMLFKLRTGNYKLFEAESRTRGREVAYIHKLKCFF